jgi:hypothetical protein
MVLLPPLQLQPLPTLHPPFSLLHQHLQSLHNAAHERPHAKTRPRDPRPTPAHHLPLAQNPQHAAQHRHVLAAACHQNTLLGQSGDCRPLDVDARARGDSAGSGVLGQSLDGGVQVFYGQGGAEDGEGDAAAVWECGGVEVGADDEIVLGSNATLLDLWSGLTPASSYCGHEAPLNDGSSLCSSTPPNLSLLR